MTYATTFVQLANRLLTQYGRAMTIRKLPVVMDPVTEDAAIGVAQEVTVKMVMTKIGRRPTAGTPELEAAQGAAFLIPAARLPFPVDETCKIVDGVNIWTVKYADVIAPNGTPIMYRVTVQL